MIIKLLIIKIRYTKKSYLKSCNLEITKCISFQPLKCMNIDLHLFKYNYHHSMHTDLCPIF